MQIELAAVAGVGKPRVFDEVSKPPRRQQDKILEFLSPIVEQYKRARSKLTVLARLRTVRYQG